MKRILKSDLAAAAGVSMRTFQRWMLANRSKLQAKGVKIRAQYVSPAAARYICREYGIDEEELWPGWFFLGVLLVTNGALYMLVFQ